MSINTRIQTLETEIKSLKARLAQMSSETVGKTADVKTTSGSSSNKATIKPVDQSSGNSAAQGGPVCWNSSELGAISIGTEPVVPSESGGKGYNKHTHTKFSGGALMADELEVVQYDWNKTSVANKHSQGYWNIVPVIQEQNNTAGQSVKMTGKIDFIFDADLRKWGVTTYEIDVRKCSFVMRDMTTNPPTIMKDSKGQDMRSPLYLSDPTKTSMVWDESGRCWRFYAVYAPDSTQI